VRVTALLGLALLPGACGGLPVSERAPAGHGGKSWPAPTNVADLTHTLDHRFPFIPVPGITFPFARTTIATMAEHGVAAGKWQIHEHLGTQIDAPSHFAAGGRALEALPAADLVAPLAVIDIRARAAGDPDAAVTVDDILAWERRHGALPPRAAVFMDSGWDARVARAADFLNVDGTGTLRFPGFSSEAAAFLLRERQVVGIGVDTLSIDPGRDRTYRTHKLWLGADRWAVECVANLGRVPAAGATVVVGGVKVRDATGGPARIFALW
jgi:kynurenine formamidase